MDIAGLPRASRPWHQRGEDSSLQTTLPPSKAAQVPKWKPTALCFPAQRIFHCFMQRRIVSPGESAVSMRLSSSP